VMKRKIILTAAMSAVILAGCSNMPELVDDFGGAETLRLETTADETDYILGGETETTVSETEAPDADETDENTDSEETDKPAAEVSWEIFDFGSLGTDEYGEGQSVGNFFIKNNIFCTDYTIIPDKGSEEPVVFQLRFFDTAQNKLLAVIDIPEGWGTYEMIPDAGGDVLCRYVISYSVFDEDSGIFNTDYRTVTVRNDFTYDISDGYTVQDRSFECCGHNIAERDPDIVDTDSGAILIAGKAAASDDDFSGTRQMYYFPIDENRFVYRTIGYERLPGFGIYDFSAGAATDVPDSEDLIPLGIHGGKIYSVKTAWDGFGTELYTTDTETLETKFFMDCPITIKTNDYVEYAMPESGNYIAFKYLPANDDASALLYGIDPDTKKYTAAVVPEELKYYSLRRSSGDRVTISNNSDRILIAEINI
ncbi:MAG: hypothetical protein K2G87_06560, partial [Oscillospiraceae bacterium]|nr:hypothetical protein [Oscillospiraceae bacterium]